VRWFAAFDPAEREVYDGPAGARLRFRTGIEPARRRIEHALEVLESLGVFQAPAQELAQLLDWLAQFDDDSMVELDYHEVSDLFDPGEMVFDDSCELVHQSLDALESGDMMLAGESYGRVVARWAPAYSVTFSN
jgi:hypothetical protein